MTAYDVLMCSLLDAWRDGVVATAAGIPATDWQSADAPHVFGGLGSSIGGRSMGRCPFVETEVTGTDWDGNFTDGGTLVAGVSCAIHVTGSDWQKASSDAYAIATAGLSVMKSDDVLRVGTVTIDPLIAGPWGQVLPVSLSVELTYDEGDFTNGG